MAGIDLDVLQILSSTHRRGAETYAVALGAALADHGCAVRSVALHGAPPPALAVPALSDRRWSVPATRRLRALVDAADVTVAHGSSTLAAAGLATIGSTTPFVYRVIGDPTVWASTRSRRTRVRALLRRAAAVATYDQRTADAVLAVHGLPAGRVHVLAKGIDLTTHRSLDVNDRADARRSLGLPADRTTVAWIGALAAEKRPMTALDVAARLPDVELIVVGDGPQREAVDQRLAADPALARRAHVLGVLADPTSVLAAADVVLLTSTTEGVPGALLEAMAAGRAVVATAAGGVAGLVDDGVTGLLVDERLDGDPLVDALAAAVAAATPVADTLGSAGRDRAEAHHDLDAVAAAWSTLLGDVAGTRP